MENFYICLCICITAFLVIFAVCVFCCYCNYLDSLHIRKSIEDDIEGLRIEIERVSNNCDAAFMTGIENSEHIKLMLSDK